MKEIVDREKPHTTVIGGDIFANRGAGFCRVRGVWVDTEGDRLSDADK
jgi:hypothetical protein